jgi:arsenate reductase
MTAHWGIPDPAAMVGSEAEIGAAFAETCRLLRNRLELLLNLPLASLDRMSLQQRLREIGETLDRPAP